MIGIGEMSLDSGPPDRERADWDVLLAHFTVALGGSPKGP